MKIELVPLESLEPSTYNPLELFAGHRYYEWFRFGEFGGWIFEK